MKPIKERIQEVIQMIEQGSSLRNACKNIKISSRTFYDVVEEDKKIELQYARAVEERAEIKFDSIEQDYMEEPQRCKETGKIDNGWVQLQRLKIDAKKWELSKLMPRKYGDKLELNQFISDIRKQASDLFPTDEEFGQNEE